MVGDSQVNGCFGSFGAGFGSEGLYRTLFEYGNDGVFVYVTKPDGMPGSFVEVNRRACELLECTKEELLALSPKDLVLPEKWQEIPDVVRKKQEAGGRLVFDTIVTTKGGRRLDVEISDYSFEIDGTSLTVSIVRDRTELRNAERQKHLAMNVCHNTLNSMKDFVSVHDKNFRVVKANKALLDFLGMQQDEVAGRFCYELFHGMDDHWPGCPHVDTTVRGEPHVQVIEDPRIGIPLEVTCSPYFDERGEILGTVHIGRDITALKAAQREKDRLIEELKLALGEFRRLSGLLPICCTCKKIRDDAGLWTPLEGYIRDRSQVEFSHGYCPDCFNEACEAEDGAAKGES